MFSSKRIYVAVGLAAVLAGCDGHVGRSAEERINEARPVKAEALEVRKSLEATLAADAAANAELHKELAARDKVRALSCAKGYTPSAFQSAEAVAKNLPDRKCFDDYDGETVQWLKGRKLRGLLAAGPLRSVPATPVSIFATTGGVNTIQFATDAPVAVVTSNNTVEVIDVGTGESIFLDRQLPEHPFTVALSPNGRVFAVGGSNGMKLRDSQSGELLLDLPDYQRFAWLDSQTGLAVKRMQPGADVLDLADNGRATPVRGVDSMPTRVLALPGGGHEFLLSRADSILRYTLKRDAGGVQAVLQDQRNGPPMTWSENVSEVTVDNAWFVQASSDLWITSLRTLETQRLPLKPYYARSATPLPNPDEILLFGSFNGVSGAPPLVYSISNHTFSPVEDDQLTAMRGYTAMRTVFIPALNRVAVITGSNVKMLQDVKRGPRYSLEALEQMLTEERRIQQEKNAREIAEREGFQLARVVDGIPVASSPIVTAATDAQIEGVGVYESANGSHGAGKPAVPGVITLNMRPSPRPIVLVVSSYEPVIWRISGARSARLKAVLMGGPGTSVVSGEEGVPVVMIGSIYTYDRGRGSGLEREVIKRTGRPFENFQGTYSGSMFIVGGR